MRTMCMVNPLMNPRATSVSANSEQICTADSTPLCGSVTSSTQPSTIASPWCIRCRPTRSFPLARPFGKRFDSESSISRGVPTPLAASTTTFAAWKSADPT